MLEQRRAKEKGYITLKEAAEISGYTSDYIGQLLRAKKIRGEQVYSGVAWMTSRQEVMAYLNNKQRRVADITTETTSDSQLNLFAESFRTWFLKHQSVIFVCLFGSTLLFAQFALYNFDVNEVAELATVSM